jgi:hypothetical protein
LAPSAGQASAFSLTNAARLDRSMALRTLDYVALANPRIEPISIR